MASDSFIGEGLAPSPYQELKKENEKLKQLLKQASDDWIPHYAILSSVIADTLRGK